MHSITAFLLAIILALAFVPAPQNQRKAPPQREITECGTTIPPEQIRAELARRNDSSLRSAITALSVNAPIQLPLTIHMVCDDNGTGGLSGEQLENAIKNLNQMWAPTGIQFFIYGGVDFSIHNTNFYLMPNDDARQDSLRLVNSVPNTINVYFAHLSGISGQARFTTSYAQGILLDYTTMADFGGGVYGLEVFAHEMGHFFDLYHTHETDFGTECPTGNNCNVAGDLLCDTPADPKLGGFGIVGDNCIYTGTASTPAGCVNYPYFPLTNNLMSYARGACRNAFTSGQINKIWQVLTTASNRKNLIEGYKFYVDPVASSSNTKCTSTAPCRTVEKAIQAARDGAIIYLKPGVHRTSSVGGNKRVSLQRWGTSGTAELRP